MMSVKQQWLRVLILIAIASVIVNALVLSLLINRYFIDFKQKNYENHFEQIINYTKSALLEDNYSSRQLTVQLEAHLSDPITNIKLYDTKGKLLIEVGSEINFRNGMMRNRMMNRMMGAPLEEVDHAEILDDEGRLIGQLNITRYSSIENSLETRMFKYALVVNSLISIGLVFILATLTGHFVSKKMSKDLIDTALFAQNIELDNPNFDNELSKVKEIRTIQQSLEMLQTKLKLKQKSRKKLIDELVHQTRTPLTILKTHIEGFEDGLIQMSPEEMKVCDNQIENLTSIIENMSNMIDAQKDIESIKIEEFEINQLLKKIISGLRTQFDKKQIELSLLTSQKVILRSDKYKLSQSIYNVLTNAYKFTNSEGRVLVSYEVIKDQLFITIEDNGIGISDHDKNKIFDAYYRSNKTRSIDGEGIGLYIVKDNIRKINGDIRVESEEGKGSKFILNIPLLQKPLSK